MRSGQSRLLVECMMCKQRMMFFFRLCLILTVCLNVVSCLFFFRTNTNSPFSAKLIQNNSNNNNTMLDVSINLPLLNLPIKLFITNNRVNGGYRQCGDRFVFESAGDVLKARSKPKGSCYSCCKIEETDITFTIHKTGDNNPMRLYQTEIGSRPLNLYKNTPTIVYIHGFLESPPLGSSEFIRDAYLSRPEPYNVILMDWSELCTFPWYLNAVDNVKVAGKVLAAFLLAYRELGEISSDNLHVIGFSLGAHVAASSSRYLGDKIRIPRITALDPALPGFQGRNQLNRKDADFVDVIHTDGGNFGILHPLGHVDFYPNGGTYFQPGCYHRDLARKNKVMNAIACSHQRAYHYFSESVRSPMSFPGVKCAWGVSQRDCNSNVIAHMGFAANPTYVSGSYYLRTNKDVPYGRTLL